MKTKPVPRPDVVTDDMLLHLDTMLAIRAIPNMFGAGPHIQTAFALDERNAEAVVLYWSESFPERHNS